MRSTGNKYKFLTSLTFTEEITIVQQRKTIIFYRIHTYTHKAHQFIFYNSKFGKTLYTTIIFCCWNNNLHIQTLKKLRQTSDRPHSSNQSNNLYTNPVHAPLKVFFFFKFYSRNQIFNKNMKIFFSCILFGMALLHFYI